MRNLDPRRARWIRVRMGILCGLLGIGLGAVVSAAFGIQVERGDEWRELAEKQRQRRLHVAPKRGTVYDRNGTPLAVSVEVPSVSVDAVEMFRGVDDRRLPAMLDEASQRIGQALNIEAAQVRDKLARRRRFTWLKRRVTAAEVSAVRSLSDPRQPRPLFGMQIEGEGRRYFPNRALAGPMLGFVSPDGEGKDGLELQLNDELRGHIEEVRGLRDRSGRLFFSEGIQDEQALAGHNVYLSIDQGIQYVAEQELEAAMRTYEAASGSIVVVDPNTGELLALASMPAFNPNDIERSDLAARRNRAITDQFEPGSTIKVFTMAAALAAHVTSPTQNIYCEEGTMAIDNVVIHDTHVSGWLTPTQVLAISSNIGAAKLGLGVGEQRLYETFQRFGFGERTNLPLPGEVAGVLRPRGRPWVQVETAAASFGQGISVSTLQLAMAISAIANRGRLLVPVLVRKITDGMGNTVNENPATVRREAVSPNVAQMVSEMLVAVTEGEGTGVEAAVPGFRTAGKTATAQKIDPATGKYTADRFTASFIGFVPAENPRVAIAVVLDEPGITHAGGSVAAPVFRRVAEMSLRYMGVTPKGSTPAPIASVGKEQDPARQAYDLFKSQSHPEAAIRPANSAAAPPTTASKQVTDVSGLPAGQALRALLQQGFIPQINGSGRVVRQQPVGGALAEPGATVQLFLESGS
ncbi:MAG: peptidoglycan glycosyltransferase [Deltaproteobacteria bacterium]|nr:peptidoglycan glycosyltransferase [Deltaproteobacteria bacterium]